MKAGWWRHSLCLLSFEIERIYVFIWRNFDGNGDNMKGNDPSDIVFNKSAGNKGYFSWECTLTKTTERSIRSVTRSLTSGASQAKFREYQVGRLLKSMTMVSLLTFARNNLWYLIFYKMSIFLFLGWWINGGKIKLLEAVRFEWINK